MPNTSLTKPKILEEVKAILGGSSVEVELIENDVEKCVRDALRVFNHNLPMRSRRAIPVTSGQKRYVISHPTLEGVTEVEFVSAQAVGASVDPFSTVGQVIVGSVLAAPGTEYGSILQTQFAQEDARKLMSAEPEWYGQWEFHTTVPEYALYVDIPTTSVSYNVAYTFAWHLTPDNVAGTGMQLAPNEDTDWIMEYILARAKQILSRKLGKFQGITNPDGATDPTDAETMRAEGREDQLRLDESILKRRRPLLPVVD